MRLCLPLAIALCLAAGPAAAQVCASTLFGDQVCDCGCGSIDPDCPTGSRFDACERSHCAAGTVPWEHQPYSCMASACGDGWNDTAGGEVCDDGNALNSGGCSATCQAVSVGYTCGERATGCALTPPDAGAPVTDAGRPAPEVDAGTGGGGGGAGGGGGTGGGGGEATTQAGCAAAGEGLLAAVALAGLRRRRRR